jgi:hypothetical protein
MLNHDAVSQLGAPLFCFKFCNQPGCVDRSLGSQQFGNLNLLALPLLQEACLMKPGPHLPGIVGALVAALKHKSPFRVAAAAGALNRISEYESVGPELLENTGAVPALLDVIRSKIPAANLEKEKALFRRYAPTIGLSAFCVCIIWYTYISGFLVLVACLLSDAAV